MLLIHKVIIKLSDELFVSSCEFRIMEGFVY